MNTSIRNGTTLYVLGASLNRRTQQPGVTNSISHKILGVLDF